MGGSQALQIHMGIAESRLPVSMHEEYFERRRETAIILRTLHPLFAYLLVGVFVGFVSIVLFAPTDWTLLAILSESQGPGEDTSVTKLVPVVALVAVFHDEITARERKKRQLGRAGLFKNVSIDLHVSYI